MDELLKALEEELYAKRKLKACQDRIRDTMFANGADVLSILVDHGIISLKINRSKLFRYADDRKGEYNAINTKNM